MSDTRINYERVYKIKIERLYHDSFRYRITINGNGMVNEHWWEQSKWAARRRAKKMIAKHEAKTEVVQEYEIHNS